MTLPLIAYVHLPLEADMRDHMYLRLWLVSQNVFFSYIPIPNGMPFYAVYFRNYPEYKRIEKLIEEDRRLISLGCRIGNVFEDEHN